MRTSRSHDPLADLDGYTVYAGFIPAQVWRAADGTWRYDGPVGLGPTAVRKAGRGPAWMGVIDTRHARDLLRRAEKAGLRVERRSR